jgi:thiosulfate/3-mercaptopyruvate sulfurtransferase
MSDTKPIVDVAWLASQRPGAVRIVDLRWTLSGKPSGREKYEGGHIPGAVFVDLDRDLSRPGGPGRHPFPDAEHLAQLLGRIGVGPDTHVVVYDDAGGSVAARLWFMLRVHGHERASVLDGGYPAWTQAGLPVSKDEPRIEPVSPPRLRPDRSRLVDRAHVERILASRSDPGRATAVVTDARAPERYRGETEPVDRVAGHIPGAVNAPFAANLREGRFRPAEELRALYERLGATRASEIVASCGSGVTACHTLLALELAGIEGGKLYVGSWSDWSSRPDAAVATGADPG